MQTPPAPSPDGRPLPVGPPGAGSMADSRALLTGQVLEGRYRVGQRLARGGMSTVYEGLDMRLDRLVAVKVMTPQYAADPTFLGRFEREARAAAGLDNPHVVGVYDQGRDGENVFLVMELVDGGTLRDLLHQQGPLSVPVALSVLEPVLGALAAAHAAGLVHRDVKPENVLISARGEVKVGDFGLVRAVTSTTMATGNVILGTVAYLSPEQVATGAADERSDVYSAGIVAYEMLTGHPPFSGDNALSVAYQHVHNDVPPVADEAPGVPEAIAAAVDAATSRDALGRPVDAADFLRRLQTARRQVGLRLVPVPVPKAPRRRSAVPPPTARPPVDPSGQRTDVAGRGTTAAGRPGRLTVAEAADRAGPPTARRGHDDRDGSFSRRRRRRRNRLIVLAVVLLLAAAAALGGWWLGGRFTSTPAVLGASQQDAVDAVRNAGLVPALSTAYDNATPSGQVAAAEPTAGTQQSRGATVSLVISSGRPVVPDVAPGTPVAAAIRMIAQADLTTATDAARDVYDNQVPSGTVVRTDPPPGTAASIGSVVLLVRSRGPVPTLVPTVAGKEPEDARNKLLVDGFTIGPDKTTFDADLPAGSVVGTDPPAGATAPYGSPISLLLAVSKTVPDVTGAEVAQAQAQLQADGFVVALGDPVFDPTAPAGQVVNSEPPAGTRIDPADPAVTLIASNAVTVPPLGGMTVRQAQRALSDLGLHNTVSSLFGNGGSPVAGQDPSAGTLVPPGSTVRISSWF